MRTVFGIGAIGEIIKQIQLALTQSGFDTGGVDGWYGNSTASAVRAYQSRNSLEPNGSIDDVCWQRLMGKPLPPVSDRALQLTAAFEGHGFGLAVGNFDGALLTWGVIGFTMASGEVQSIVLSLNKTHPDRVQEAFGQHSGELITLMQASRDDQTLWANEHTVIHRALAEPWKSMFANFGSFPEVQDEQLAHVRSDYFLPSIVTAKRLGLKSELALALCFDIHVQNGGIKHTAMDQIDHKSTPGISEGDRLSIVANAVADWAKPAWREDVRRRKLTIATGNGTMHGHTYVLENWGLSEHLEASDLISTTAQVA